MNVCGVARVTISSPPIVPVVAVKPLTVKFSEELPFASALELSAVLTAVNSVLKSAPEITFPGSVSA